MLMRKKMDAVVYGKLWTWFMFIWYTILPIICIAVIIGMGFAMTRLDAERIALKQLAVSCMANYKQFSDALLEAVKP